MEKRKLMRIHHVNNISTALSFLERKKVAFKSSNRTRPQLDYHMQIVKQKSDGGDMTYVDNSISLKCFKTTPQPSVFKDNH
jgi:hypothetical protein